MARRKEPVEEGAPAWMATYGDLVTNLLVFFVLLFSLSTVDESKFDEVAASLSHSIINFGESGAILDGSGNSILTFDFTKNGTDEDEAKRREKYLEDAKDMVVDAEGKLGEKYMDDAKKNIRDVIDQQGISDKVQVIEETDFVMIRLEQELFFDSGSAEVRAAGQEVLSQIAQALRGINNEILVSGHTDNIPQTNKNYATNWELSTARATNVVRYLVEIDNLNPALFTATGNGEFKPVASNDTVEGRQKNRRIEIKLLK